MNTRELKNHPGHYLRTDAADAFDAMEDEYGVIVLNRAGVPEAVQQSLIDRWNEGGPANRPPFLYEPKRPAKASEHVQFIAVDVYNYTSDRHKLNKYGFEWYGPKDPVHYTFIGWNRPSGGTTNKEEEDEAMFVNVTGKAGHRSGGLYYIANGQATYLGGVNKAFPTLSSENADNLAKRVRGL